MAPSGPQYLSLLLSHLQPVIDQMPSAVYVCEAPSGVIRLYNERAAEFWGRAPKLGDTDERFCGAFRLFRPDGRALPHAETPMADALRGGTSRDEEVIIERPDGSRLPVSVNIGPLRDPDGQIVGAINAFQDISDRKLAEDAARLAAIVAAAADPIIGMTPDGTITSWNRAAVRMFGWTAAEAIGQPITLIILPDRHFEQKEVLAGIRRGESVEPFETIRVAKDGRPIDTHLTVSPIRDAAGLVIGASNVARDITEKKQSEAALRRSESERADLLVREQTARTEAESANRSKDEFLTMLAHELRNPLSVVVNANAVLGASRLDPQAERARATLGRNTQHLSRMLDDLFDIARITRGRIELQRDDVDLRTVAEQAIEGQAQQVNAKRQSLMAALPNRPVVVLGDAVRLQQVLSNLLNNAVKYTPAGGTVWLSLEEETETAVLRVRDDGRGVPPHKLGVIFELFTQATPTMARTEGGLGIGLTVVNRLVQMHGGSVQALSEGVGRGAEFVVRLPLAPRRAATTVAPAVAPTSRTARRVLVIEDNDDGRDMLVALLRLNGHEVFEASGGNEGLAEAARRAPDVVLIDIGLPDMDGYDVGRQLRGQLPSAHLIALTGYGQPSDRERSAHAGFHTHLVKPVDPTVLVETLQAV